MTLTTPQRSREPARAVVRRWDPFREMEDVYDRMGQLVQDFLPDTTPGRGSAGLSGWATPADIEETDDAYVVELDLPGVRPGDANVDLRDNELRVSGEIKDKERKGVMRRRTRRIGQFEHVIMLPGDVDRDNVEARLADGVLTVRIGKAKGSQPRHIEVKGS